MPSLYKAMELVMQGTHTGLYHYTKTDLLSLKTYTVGYCAQMAVCPECKGMSNPLSLGPGATPFQIAQLPECDRCRNTGFVRHPDPCPGHDCEQLCREHYKEFLRDTAGFTVKMPADKGAKRCAICGKLGDTGAALACAVWIPLCSFHLNGEGVMRALGELPDFQTES